jgi:hypothetical protein
MPKILDLLVSEALILSKRGLRTTVGQFVPDGPVSILSTASSSSCGRS